MHTHRNCRHTTKSLKTIKGGRDREREGERERERWIDREIER